MQHVSVEGWCACMEHWRLLRSCVGGDRLFIDRTRSTNGLADRLLHAPLVLDHAGAGSRGMSREMCWRACWGMSW